MALKYCGLEPRTLHVISYTQKKCTMFGGARRFSRASGWRFHSTEKAEKAKESGFARFARLASENKQALINTLGVYFVLSFSVHNYRVEKAWNEREVEFKALEEEIDRMKSTLKSPQWIQETEQKVKANRWKSVLGGEISTVLQLRGERERVLDKQGIKAGGSEASGLAELASLVDGGSGKAADKKSVKIV